MNDIATQLSVMAELQESHNRQVHPEWEQQGHAYYRAVWVECAELLDHYGWKWWKRQEADLDQVRLEIVDIWHFGLSELIRAGLLRSTGADPGIVAAVEAGLAARPSDFRAAVESLAARTLESRGFPIAEFFTVMRSLPMSFDELFRHYVGKNVLNQFRQTHGYQAGTYRKNWGGREDNVHLMEIAAALDDTSPRFADNLFAALETRYLASAAS
jgi:dimeric dUTPase (all-alpha-NTP-PPase superfamily)